MTAPLKPRLQPLKLFLHEEGGSNQEEIGSVREEIRKYQEEIGRYQEIVIPNLEKQIEETQKKIKDLEENLKKAPGPIELAQLRTRSEELEKHNSTLKGELEKAERDKEDLKTTYNNYFLQVQTLINQKSIEAPGEKRKPWYKFW
jgi:predicted RNase H-like nuclease (RuvC/YqgF family)